MWEFGTVRHLDFDRWTATKGAIGGNYGSLIVKSREGRSVLVSPDRIPIRPEHHDLLVLGIKHRAALDKVEVMAHTGEGKKSISGSLEVSNLAYTAAGIEIPIDWRGTIPEQGFDIVFSFSGIVNQFQLDHIVLVGTEKRNPTNDLE